jgi:EthD domain
MVPAFGIERRVINRGSAMIKVSVLLKRKPGMSPAEFYRYWKDVHGPLVLGVPELMRHVRKYVPLSTQIFPPCNSTTS